MKINFKKRLDLYDLEFNLEEIQAMEVKILQENQIVPSLFFCRCLLNAIFFVIKNGR